MDFLILFGLFQMAHSQFDSKLTNQRVEHVKADQGSVRKTTEE